AKGEGANRRAAAGRLRAGVAAGRGAAADAGAYYRQPSPARRRRGVPAQRGGEEAGPVAEGAGAAAPARGPAANATEEQLTTERTTRPRPGAAHFLARLNTATTSRVPSLLASSCMFASSTHSVRVSPSSR